jgi:hypothetical protein
MSDRADDSSMPFVSTVPLISLFCEEYFPIVHFLSDNERQLSHYNQ